jgi:hypothetical protein
MGASSSACCEATPQTSVETIEALRIRATREDEDERDEKKEKVFFPRSLTSDSTTGTGDPSVQEAEDSNADGTLSGRSSTQIGVSSSAYRRTKKWQIHLEKGEMDWSLGADVRDKEYNMPFLTLRGIMPDSVLEKYNDTHPATAAKKGDRIVAINECNEGARELINAMRSANKLRITLERLAHRH